MKPERIEELLAGTKYADKTCKDHRKVNIEARCITTWTEVAGDKAIMEDRRLNAARVQLLAKALLFYANKEHYFDQLNAGRQLRTSIEADMGKIAKAALAEAGLQEEDK